MDEPSLCSTGTIGPQALYAPVVHDCARLCCLQGMAAKQGVNINSSLSTLTDVINKLSKSGRQQPDPGPREIPQEYIGYRNSNITKLLRSVVRCLSQSSLCRFCSRNS